MKKIFILTLTMSITACFGPGYKPYNMTNDQNLKTDQLSQFYHSKYTVIKSIDGKNTPECLETICGYSVSPGKHKIEVGLLEEDYEGREPKGTQFREVETKKGEKYEVSSMYLGKKWSILVWEGGRK